MYIYKQNKYILFLSLYLAENFCFHNLPKTALICVFAMIIMSFKVWPRGNVILIKRKWQKRQENDIFWLRDLKFKNKFY